MRRVVLTLVTAAISTSAGCGTDGESLPGSRRPAANSIVSFGFIGRLPPDSRRAAIRRGAAAFLAGSPNVRTEFFDIADAGADVRRRRFDGLASARPSVIAVYAENAQIAGDCLETARSHSIPLILMDDRTDDLRASGRVTCDPAQAAELIASNLLPLAGEGRGYILIHESSTDDVAERIYARFQTVARRAAGVTRLAECDLGRPAAGDVSGARAVPQQIESLLARYRSTSLVVLLLRRSEFLPGASWLAELRAKYPSVRFAVNSVDQRLWPFVRSGEIAALAGPLDGTMGRLAAEMAYQSLIGTTPEADRSVPAELVTPENLRDFERRYREAAGGE
jgi:ABC-type sugar transport system substrate-binding protein